MKILVVDDEKEVTLTLEGFFLAKGYKMFTALSGDEAIEAIDTKRPDIVLLDMKMPGLNGIEVLKYIKKHYPKIKVIVITAYDEEYRQKTEQIGADGFLTKPFGLRVLTETIEDVIARKKLQKLEREEELKYIKPNARLLFVEPSSPIYAVLSLHFGIRQSGKGNALIKGADGEYQTEHAFTKEDALNKLRLFKPDIVLIDLSTLGRADELAVEVMNSQYKPKDVILYGLTISIAERVKFEQVRAKTWEGSFLDPDDLSKLDDLVKEIALAHGLVKP